MPERSTEAFVGAVATALSRRLAAAGLGPLAIAGSGPDADAAAAAAAAFLQAAAPSRAGAGAGATAGAGAGARAGARAGTSSDGTANRHGGGEPGAVLAVGPDAADGERLAGWIDETGWSVRFSGRAMASPAGRPEGRPVPFALLDPFDPATVGPAPDGFEVLAVVTTYNEVDIVDGLLDRLLTGGLRVHVVDNWSTDGTAQAVADRARQSLGRLTHERFPAAHPSPYFELETLLRRVEQVADGSGAAWIVHHDADEIRQAPWPGVGLRDALYALDRWGFTVADHTVANFVATDDRWLAGGDLPGHFGHLELGEAAGHFLQEKAWRRPADGHVEMASSGGHLAVHPDKRVFPYKLLTRHYPIRSTAHGQRKLLADRRARFSPAERRRGWHTHYDLLGERPDLVRPDTALLVPADALDGPLLLQRLTGAGLPGNPFPGEGPAGPVPAEAVPAGAAAETALAAGELAAGELAAGELAGGGSGRGGGGRQVLVRVQSVLYEPSPASLARYLRTLAQSIGVLTGRHPEVTVDVALADNSPVATYDDDGIERARWGFTGSGTRAVHYRHLPDNPGHGGAHNALFAELDRPQVLVVCNPDTVPAPTLLLRLVERLAHDATVGIVEARQLPLEHQKDYDHTRGDTSWASGACCAVEGELYGSLGGFDADTFFLYCDDVDLSWRCRLHGARVVYEPAARILHDKRLSPGAAEQPSDVEIYHSGLASLLLPWKYSRPDLADAHVVDFAQSPLPIHHAVADAFSERRRDGRLPAPIDPDHQVGDFSTYAYAPLRFDYAR